MERYTARFRFRIPAAGRYVLWTRRHLLYIDEGALPLIDRLHRYISMGWRIDEGAWHWPAAEPTPVNVEGAFPSAVGHLGFTRTGDAETAGKYIGWYLDDAVDLSAGEHRLDVVFRVRQPTLTPLIHPQPHRYYGLLDAFALAEPGFVPSGRLPPVQALIELPSAPRPVERGRVVLDASAPGDTLPNLTGFSLVPRDPRLEERFRALRPGLIRLTHLYNLANVTRDASGRLSIDWTDLDRAVDHIFRLGSEPLMCIGYTPGCLSTMPSDAPAGPGAGDPGMYPPSDYALWEEVVFRTVRHFNVERGTPIRYWEVWNEPNSIFLQVWHIWPWMDGLPLVGPFLAELKKLAVYCTLYEHAARGAVRADPSLRIGGPAAICDGDVYDVAGSVRWWVQALAWWCALWDVRLDFVSLHLYAGPPDSSGPATYYDLIRRARRWGSLSDREAPEVIVDEWNAASMEGGHDTVTPYHAVWVMETLDAMRRAGARRSVYFGAGTDWLGLFRTDAYLPTPTYNLFRLVGLLEPERIAVASAPDGLGVLASRSKERITVLLWRFGVAPADVEVSLGTAGFGDRTPVHYRRFLIDAHHSNLRAPSGRADLEPVAETVLNPSDDLRVTERLPPTSVTLLVFERM